jgi:hypothetical protein
MHVVFFSLPITGSMNPPLAIIFSKTLSREREPSFNIPDSFHTNSRCTKGNFLRAAGSRLPSVLTSKWKRRKEEAVTRDISILVERVEISVDSVLL